MKRTCWYKACLLLLKNNSLSYLLQKTSRLYLKAGVVAQVKKGNKTAVLQAKKEVGVRAILPRAGYHVALDDVVHGQAQNIFIKMPGFFGITGAVGEMVQLVDRCRGRQCGDVLRYGGHMKFSNESAPNRMQKYCTPNRQLTGHGIKLGTTFAPSWQRVAGFSSACLPPHRAVER